MTELEKATWEFLFDTPSISLLKHGSPYSDLVEAVTSDREKAFIAGAEWQKKQTSEQAMKYLQEHHSPSELSDFQAAMNIAVAKAIGSTINKSIEWLKDNIHYDDFGGNMEWYVPFADDDEMVENLKKAMEE